MAVASIHAQKNRAGNTYRVLWREDGRQRSLTFENLPAAERFKTLLEDHGPDEALRIIELDEIGRHVPTVTEWLTTHIDNLTGVQLATVARYRTYVARDINPVFGSMPVSSVTETTIAKWVKQLVFIGAQPQSAWLTGVVELDEHGFVLTGSDLDTETDGVLPVQHRAILETSEPGIFAAGDVRRGATRRVAAAMGEGAIAVALVNQYLASIGHAVRHP
jgi:NADPH-dependent glutamate synthase beta subunit-like oxidoreductase